MRAIVTGAARGIGRAIAERIARDARQTNTPLQLILVDQHGDEVEAVAAGLRTGGAEVQALAGNMADPQLPSAIAQAASNWGGLDALASNVGYAQPGDLAAYTIEDWDQMFAVNVRSHWLLAKACYPLLKQAQGKVVFTTSISASNPTTPLGAYSPCKAALLMLMRQLSVEWAPQGIRVNSVSPGMTLTPGTSPVYQDAQVRQQREARIPARRIGTPEDIAGAVAYLLGPDADYVHGVELLVDGGLDKTVMVNPVMDGWRAARRQSGAN
jgi:glucose 1-dehydrogenase